MSVINFGSRAARSSLQDVPEGLVGPVVDPDEIIEIEKSEGKRCVRFLEDAEKLSRSFSPARTVYSSSRLDPWQKLEGNTNLARLVEEGPHPIRVWYQLKIVKINECPTWPMDADLDRIMRFISTNGRITSVSYMRLRRVKKGDRLVLAPDDVLYPEGRENLHVNDWAVPLDGLWGRQWAVTDVSDDFWKPSAVVPHTQVYSLWLRIWGSEY